MVEQSLAVNLPQDVELAASSTAVRRSLARAYSLGEEIANSVIHGLGSALAVAGLTLLVSFAALWGNAWHLASSIVYGSSLVALYTASTLYHAVTSERAKYIFKILDHSAIYLLIAGSYTPFTLVTLRDSGGWYLFAVVWGLAVAGIACEAFWVFRPKWVSALIFLGMGWLVVALAGPLWAGLPTGGLWLLLAGGLAYSLGTIFYVLKRIPYMHAVWHLFVLGASVCHFLAVVLYVLPSHG